MDRAVIAPEGRTERDDPLQSYEIR
jgi:hypothetical protein